MLTIPAAFYLKAQDISELRNIIDVYSNNPITGTAKYTAMAGSMGALGGDISSSNNNPAGIGVNIASDLNISLSTMSNKNTSTLAGLSLTNKQNKTDLGNVSGVIAFDLTSLNSNWKFVNIGLNYTSVSLNDQVLTPGNNKIIVNKNLIDASNNPVVGQLAYNGHVYNRDGYYDKTNFTIGANYNNNLYFGIGLNMSAVNYTQDDFANFRLNLNNLTDNYEKQYTPYLEQSRGFSANFGLIAKLNNQFRVGAAVETPTWWNNERVYKDYQIDNNGLTDTAEFSEERNLRTAFKTTLSAAFVPSKNFSFNIDYIQSLGQPKYTTNSNVNTEINNFYSDHYKNSAEVRFGAEYRLEGLRVRAGYAFASNPFDNISTNAYNEGGIIANQNYNNFIVSKRNTFGAGLGYDFKAFYIDAAYQNIQSEYNNPFLYGSATQGTGYYSGNFDINSEAYAVSSVKNKRDNFVFTLGWKF